MSRKQYTREEWTAEGRRRFGDKYVDWRFVCPHCGNVASGHEFKAARAVPYQECIGRYVETHGCDWAAYGLFDICTAEVIENGHSIPVFEFALTEDDDESLRMVTGDRHGKKILEGAGESDVPDDCHGRQRGAFGAGGHKKPAVAVVLSQSAADAMGTGG